MSDELEVAAEIVEWDPRRQCGRVQTVDGRALLIDATTSWWSARTAAEGQRVTLVLDSAGRLLRVINGIGEGA